MFIYLIDAVHFFCMQRLEMQRQKWGEWNSIRRFFWTKMHSGVRKEEKKKKKKKKKEEEEEVCGVGEGARVFLLRLSPVFPLLITLDPQIPRLLS
jgi:hypothetical protein